MGLPAGNSAAAERPMAKGLSIIGTKARRTVRIGAGDPGIAHRKDHDACRQRFVDDRGTCGALMGRRISSCRSSAWNSCGQAGTSEAACCLALWLQWRAVARALQARSRFIPGDEMMFVRGDPPDWSINRKQRWSFRSLLDFLAGGELQEIFHRILDRGAVIAPNRR